MGGKGEKQPSLLTLWRRPPTSIQSQLLRGGRSSEEGKSERKRQGRNLGLNLNRRRRARPALSLEPQLAPPRAAPAQGAPAQAYERKHREREKETERDIVVRLDEIIHVGTEIGEIMTASYDALLYVPVLIKATLRKWLDFWYSSPKTIKQAVQGPFRPFLSSAQADELVTIAEFLVVLTGVESTTPGLPQAAWKRADDVLTATVWTKYRPLGRWLLQGDQEWLPLDAKRKVGEWEQLEYHHTPVILNPPPNRDHVITLEQYFNLFQSATRRVILPPSTALHVADARFFNAGYWPERISESRQQLRIVEPRDRLTRGRWDRLFFGQSAETLSELRQLNESNQLVSIQQLSLPDYYRLLDRRESSLQEWPARWTLDTEQTALEQQKVQADEKWQSMNVWVLKRPSRKLYLCTGLLNFVQYLVRDAQPSWEETLANNTPTSEKSKKLYCIPDNFWTERGTFGVGDYKLQQSWSDENRHLVDADSWTQLHSVPERLRLSNNRAGIVPDNFYLMLPMGKVAAGTVATFFEYLLGMTFEPWWDEVYKWWYTYSGDLRNHRACQELLKLLWIWAPNNLTTWAEWVRKWPTVSLRPSVLIDIYAHLIDVGGTKIDTRWLPSKSDQDWAVQCLHQRAVLSSILYHLHQEYSAALDYMQDRKIERRPDAYTAFVPVLQKQSREWVPLQSGPSELVIKKAQQLDNVTEVTSDVKRGGAIKTAETGQVDVKESLKLQLERERQAYMTQSKGALIYVPPNEKKTWKQWTDFWIRDPSVTPLPFQASTAAAAVSSEPISVGEFLSRSMVLARVSKEAQNWQLVPMVSATAGLSNSVEGNWFIRRGVIFVSNAPETPATWAELLFGTEIFAVPQGMTLVTLNDYLKLYDQAMTTKLVPMLVEPVSSFPKPLLKTDEDFKAYTRAYHAAGYVNLPPAGTWLVPIPFEQQVIRVRPNTRETLVEWDVLFYGLPEITTRPELREPSMFDSKAKELVPLSVVEYLEWTKTRRPPISNLPVHWVVDNNKSDFKTGQIVLKRPMTNFFGQVCLNTDDFITQEPWPNDVTSTAMFTIYSPKNGDWSEFPKQGNCFEQAPLIKSLETNTEPLYEWIDNVGPNLVADRLYKLFYPNVLIDQPSFELLQDSRNLYAQRHRRLLLIPTRTVSVGSLGGYEGVPSSFHERVETIYSLFELPVRALRESWWPQLYRWWWKFSGDLRVFDGLAAAQLLEILKDVQNGATLGFSWMQFASQLMQAIASHSASSNETARAMTRSLRMSAVTGMTLFAPEGISSVTILEDVVTSIQLSQAVVDNANKNIIETLVAETKLDALDADKTRFSAAVRYLYDNSRVLLEIGALERQRSNAIGYISKIVENDDERLDQLHQFSESTPDVSELAKARLDAGKADQERRRRAGHHRRRRYH